MPPVNAGVLEVEYAVIDMTGGITNAGNEPWDPEANTGLTNVDAVEVVGQTDAGVNATWDWENDQLLVKYADYDAAADGKLIDLPAGTAAGKVRVRVEGRR